MTKLGSNLKTVDVYDGAKNEWSVVELSEPRAVFAIGAAGKKVLIAGGVYRDGIFSKAVDIFTVQ